MRRRPLLPLITVLAAALGLTASPSLAAANKGGKAITTGKSAYGRMLFDAHHQAIYAFGLDEKNKSNCYDDCAKAWPPVLTKKAPRAKGAVKAKLLGTTMRDDGTLQVTYAGKPLYFYVNEGPGEVLCHNVFLNGGMWWVLGANGKHRP